MFAADNPTPVRFEVEAPCTDAPRFADSVAARTRRIKPTQAQDADTVQVRVEATHGSFRIVPAGGEPSASRTLDGATCEEIVSALGLAVALVFDPGATSTPAPKPEPEPSPEPKQQPPSRPKPPPPAPPPATVEPSSMFAVGVQGTLAVADGTPLGTLSFAELVDRRWTARLSAGFRIVDVDVAPQGSTFIMWAEAVPDACPLRLVRGAFELAPCAGFAFGFVEASPSNIPNATSITRAWLAPKPIVRARLALASSFAIEAQAALEIPLVRSRYVFGGALAYEIAPLVPTFGLGGWFSL